MRCLRSAATTRSRFNSRVIESVFVSDVEEDATDGDRGDAMPSEALLDRGERGDLGEWGEVGLRGGDESR